MRFSDKNSSTQLLLEKWQVIASWPLRLHSVAETREIDARAIAAGTPGIVLMKRAAQAVLDRIMDALADGASSKVMIVVFCGSGNNAGDGFLIAKLAHEQNLNVHVVEVADASRLKGDAASARKALLSSNLSPELWSETTSESLVQKSAGHNLVIVDALLGTGISGELRPSYRDAIRWINHIRQVGGQSKSVEVIAVDVPSGLNADTGRVDEWAIHADSTVSFITIKKGLLTGAAPDYCGDIYYSDLELGERIESFSQSNTGFHLSRLDLPSISNILPKRSKTSHKYSNLPLAIIAGGENMGGAAILCASAAVSMGATLVHLKTHHSHSNAALVAQPEILVEGLANKIEEKSILPEKLGVAVVGPGMGRSDWSRQLLSMLLDEAATRHIRLVLDADALTLLGESQGLRDKLAQVSDKVLTPHEGEARRLLSGIVSPGRLEGLEKADRFSIVQTLAEHYQSTVILKGAGTLIASEHSDRTEKLQAKIDLCPYGNDILATGGTGDVLAGLVGALIAQGLSMREAAVTAVGLHAAAADRWRADYGRFGFSASCLLDTVPALANQLAYD